MLSFGLSPGFSVFWLAQHRIASLSSCCYCELHCCVKEWCMMVTATGSSNLPHSAQKSNKQQQQRRQQQHDMAWKKSRKNPHFQRTRSWRASFLLMCCDHPFPYPPRCGMLYMYLCLRNSTPPNKTTQLSYNFKIKFYKISSFYAIMINYDYDTMIRIIYIYTYILYHTGYSGTVALVLSYISYHRHSSTGYRTGPAGYCTV